MFSMAFDIELGSEPIGQCDLEHGRLDKAIASPDQQYVLDLVHALPCRSVEERIYAIACCTIK